jgi:CDP-diacylglycerol--glycerol-3-phosphate 3-phosphatidyltransferase
MANHITISRIFLIIPVLILVTPDTSSNNWLALTLFVIAGLTDHLDGYLARKTNTESNLGALLDLLADKLLVVVALSYLVSFDTNDHLLFPTLIMISREIAISSLRQFISEQGRGQIKVSSIAKSKTTFQIVAIAFLIISPNFGEIFSSITTFLFWIAAIVSLASLAGYLRQLQRTSK